MIQSCFDRLKPLEIQVHSAVSTKRFGRLSRVRLSCLLINLLNKLKSVSECCENCIFCFEYRLDFNRKISEFNLFKLCTEIYVSLFFTFEGIFAKCFKVINGLSYQK